MCGLKILPGSSFDKKLRMHSVERNTVGFGSHHLTVCMSALKLASFSSRSHLKRSKL